MASGRSTVTLESSGAPSGVDQPAPPRRGRSGLWRGLVVGLVLAVVDFLTLSAVFFVWPTSDTPRPVGAVLNLNGSDEGSSARLAVSLVARGTAPVLLFSEGTDPPYCPRVPRVQVVCFLPRPARTVGEIAFAAQYLRQHHIRSILIVADHAQTTRVRLLAQRCLPGRSLVVSTPTSWSVLPSEVVYEWGAIFKALVVDRGCH